jgi:hypothetical protein
MLNTAIGEETVVQTILNFMKTLDAEVPLPGARPCLNRGI